MVHMDIQDFLQAMGEDLSHEGAITTFATDKLYDIGVSIEDSYNGENYTIWGNDVLDALDNTDYYNKVTDLMNQRFPLQVMIDDSGNVKLENIVRDTEEQNLYPFDSDHVKNAISKIASQEVEVIGYGRLIDYDYYTEPECKEHEFLVSVSPMIDDYLNEAYEEAYQYVAEIVNEHSIEEILENTNAYLANSEKNTINSGKNTIKISKGKNDDREVDIAL